MIYIIIHGQKQYCPVTNTTYLIEHIYQPVPRYVSFISTEETSIMSTLEIASKADPALMLSSLLTASHLEQVPLLQPVIKHFQDVHAVDGKEAVRMTFNDEKILIGKEIVPYFTNLATSIGPALKREHAMGSHVS
jgi:hypothetical protein